MAIQLTLAGAGDGIIFPNYFSCTIGQLPWFQTNPDGNWHEINTDVWEKVEIRSETDWTTTTAIRGLETGNIDYCGSSMGTNVAPGAYQFWYGVSGFLSGAGTFRIPELDRSPWGSSVISAAEANISAGRLKFVTNAIDLSLGTATSPGAQYEINGSGTWYCKTDTYTEAPNGTFGLGLCGIRYEGSQWELNPLLSFGNIGGTWDKDHLTITKKSDVSGFVKTYLDQRLNYSAFSFYLSPPNALDYQTLLYGDWKEALVSLHGSTITDTRHMETFQGAQYCVGHFETRRLEWETASITSPIAHFNTSPITLSEYDRVPEQTIPV
jgi:hypothetical protein